MINDIKDENFYKNPEQIQESLLEIERKYQLIDKKQQEIVSLMNKLSSSASDIGDWKIIKCYEAKLNENEMPYDINDLMTKRSEVRKQINLLQDEMEKLK